MDHPACTGMCICSKVHNKRGVQQCGHLVSADARDTPITDYSRMSLSPTIAEPAAHHRIWSV
eukprot:34975-Amphidinium_carterae.1